MNRIIIKLQLARSEKGSLSLENILFITAVAGIATFVTAFYVDLGQWFEGVSLPDAPDLSGS